MTTLSLPFQISDLINGQGASCDYGCSEESLLGLIALGKEMYPNKPYRVVRKWSWADIEVNESQTELLRQNGLKPAFIYANEIVEDGTGKFAVGNAVRTTPLIAFHNNCLFVTANTVYILLGPGCRMTVDIAVYDAIFF